MYVDPNNPLKLQISDVHPSDAGTYSCFPLKVHWRLTIEVTENKPELLREVLLYTVPSVTGAVVVCFIFICSIRIYRKRKTRNKEPGVELQPQGRRMDRFQNSQYFERFNSLYGTGRLT
ncbi:hypothetical protein NFI96_023840 [Prochilodus magdalenae]|nr:hypothetical protein NFI96_023840 [Prochilodus magdalenae]